MKKIRIIFLLIFSVAFAMALIMKVTPWLYQYHPYNSMQMVDEVTPVITENNKFIAQQSSGERPSIGDLGTFGDSAGFWNAIFSGLAILGVVYTLFYQFDKDKNDDERARLEQFHNQCIAMIGMLSDIVSQLKITDGRSAQQLPVSNEISNIGWSASNDSGVNSGISQPFAQTEYVVTGRACFKYIFDERPQQRNLKDYITTRPYVTDDYIPDEEFYASLRKVTEDHFDHYFRTLYRILRFIESCDLGGVDEKKEMEARNRCSALLRAQLSTYEIAVIYYNSLFKKFRNTSKALYERICLFDNMDPNLLILKSEREYYLKLQWQKKNLSQYDCTIHYNYTAFVKQNQSEVEPNFMTRIHLFLGRGFRSLENSSVCNNLSNPEWKVFRTIKGVGGAPISDRELAHKAEVSINDLRQIVSAFEEKDLLVTFYRDAQKIYKLKTK